MLFGKAAKHDLVEDDHQKQMAWKWFYTIVLLTGVVLGIFTVEIYRYTILSIKVPCLIVVIATFVAFLVMKKHYQKVYKVKKFFFPLMQAMLSFGLITCYLFMGINYYAANNDIKSYVFEIKAKSSLVGPKGKRHKSKPVVKINYFGTDKELIFDHQSTARVTNSNSVILKVKSGALGFDVVDSYDVELKQ